MVNLLDSCSLDINFDTANNNIIYGDKIYPESRNKISLKNLIPALLNKSLHYPELVYEEHVQVFHEDHRNVANTGISYDVLCLPAGLLGVEFIKSHVFYAPAEEPNGTVSTVVEVIFGVLTIIMQKNLAKDEFEFHTSVQEGLIVKLHKGEKIAIPKGYFYTFINTEETPVLFVRIYRKKGILDYSILKKERGLAYYCIRKNARQEIVHNPIYRNIPQIKELTANAFLDLVDISPQRSLYTEMMSKTNDLLKELWW